MASPAEVFTEYLAAFSRADLDRARELVTDDFSFSGPALQAEGREAFFDGAGQLAPAVRGYTMLRQWEDVDEVCSIYEFKLETPAGAGSVLMSEWNRVRDGRLASTRLVYDSAEFARFMPSQ